MRKLALLSVLLVLAAPAAAAGPKLTVTGTSPFTVHGYGFHPSEHVHVVAAARTSGSRWATAGIHGGFVVRLPAVRVADRCASYTVRATGSDGSRASIRFIPECAMP